MQREQQALACAIYSISQAYKSLRFSRLNQENQSPYLVSNVNFSVSKLRILR
jgi:hypothetical protein